MGNRLPKDRGLTEGQTIYVPFVVTTKWAMGDGRYHAKPADGVAVNWTSVLRDDGEYERVISVRVRTEDVLTEPPTDTMVVDPSQLEMWT